MDGGSRVRRPVARPIVVGYDGSRASNAAARWAARTAQRLGRMVRVLHVVPWPAISGGGSSAIELGTDTLGRTAERLLDRSCEDVRRDHPDVAIDAEVVIGHPVPVLLREAAGGSLVVLGANERRELPPGSLLEHLATHSSIPVVAVPAGWRSNRGDQVVVGVDGSAESGNALAFGLEFAEQTDAEVTAVLAYRDPRLLVGEDASVLLRDATAAEAGGHPEVELTEKLVQGNPSNVLAEESRDAALLVVGSRGRSRIRGSLLGGVSRAVLRRPPCPVAVVR
ncbi:universal stress protein [Kribbella sp. NPDC048915]|uniref:universal stress protein n=1 Tax=Kribbella sp. NPDC048915 TaxID=3155148 RepID=UPI0033FF0198